MKKKTDAKQAGAQARDEQEKKAPVVKKRGRGAVAELLAAPGAVKEADVENAGGAS